jgi:hypothetical protein
MTYRLFLLVGSSNGVSVAFNSPNFSHFWFADFAAAGAVPYYRRRL